MSDDSTADQIGQIIAEHGRLPASIEDLPASASLYEAGMTSHASVSVMLALEDHFDIEFPDEMLTRSAFESIEAIAAAVGQLTAEASV